MSARQLPESFSDLEQFAARWALPTENERHARRQASTMAELRSFYDAVLPRIDAIFAYLNDFPLDGRLPSHSPLAFYRFRWPRSRRRSNYSGSRKFPTVLTPVG
jgi:hypothetical protein